MESVDPVAAGANGARRDVPAEGRLLSDRVAAVDFDPMGWVDLWRAWVR